MKLNSTVIGEGAPLLLIHGLFGSLENLGALARVLKDDFQVYSLDLPNHGRSYHSNSADLAAMASAVVAWMDGAGLNSASVIGHSLGGKVAMEIALGNPERVDNLVVMDIAPVAYDPHHRAIFEALDSLDFSALSSRADIDTALARSVPEASVRSFLLKNLVRSEGGAYKWRINLAGLHNNYPALIGENCTKGQYPRHTLFIKGANSDYIREQHHTAIMQRFPRAEFKVVADTGHWLHAEKPALVGSLIKKFLHHARR